MGIEGKRFDKMEFEFAYPNSFPHLQIVLIDLNNIYIFLTLHKLLLSFPGFHMWKLRAVFSGVISR